jgi:universal stress protein A
VNQAYFDPPSHPILVPTDFSGQSKKALRVASRLAECTGLPLLVLHVVHEAGDQAGYYRQFHGKEYTARPLWELAEDMLTDFLDGVAQTVPDFARLGDVRTKLVMGLPANRICEVIDQEQAALAVMGSHGRTGLAHLMMGSVAEQVVRNARVPVTIVKRTDLDLLNDAMPRMLNIPERKDSPVATSAGIK